jgi:drug/metabolite transporter (DMT)-like permease
VSSRLRGVVELVAAALFFGSMAYVAKMTTRTLDGAQTALVRFIIGIAVVLGYHGGRWRRLRVVRADLLLVRGFFGGLAVLCYFLALAHLPVGTATLLNYSAPIFTATFAALFLDEAVPGGTLAALITACVGVGLVVYGQGRALGGGYFWLAVGVASAVCSGAAVTAIRAARRTDNAWTVFLAFGVMGAVCVAPFAAHAWRTPTPGLWGLLLLVGVLAAGGQLLMTHALGSVDAATSGIISQLTPLVALLLGHFLDGEPFAALSLVGGVLTLIGVSVVSLGPGMRGAIAR